MPTLYSRKAKLRTLFVYNNINRIFLGLFLCSLLQFSANAQTQPTTFSKSFSPSTIGPGSTSTLTFTITNNSGSDIENVAFTDNLPDGVTIASVPGASTTCLGGILSAPVNGKEISFSGGKVLANSSCTISLDVTGNDLFDLQNEFIENRINVTSTLFGNGVDQGVSATATLTVKPDRPGFSKSFSPSLIAPNGTSTLTFTIDNSENTGAAPSLAFSDNLPGGLMIATPANIRLDTSGCGGGTIIAAGTTISYSGGTVAAGLDCTMSVDVTAADVGTYVNISSALTTFGEVSSGFASAALKVADPLMLTKSFTNDPVPPGGIVTLEFTLNNQGDLFNNGRDFAGTFNSIAFSDNLNTTLANLIPVAGQFPIAACGGNLDESTPGSGILEFSDGSLASGESCTISVSLQVDAGSAIGTYLNTTSNLTSDAGNGTVTGAPATDNLVVSPVPPILTKEFLDATTLASDPVAGAGEDVVIRFTLTNNSSSENATDVAFIDELTNGAGAVGTTGGFLPFPIVATLPTSACGGSISLTSPGTERTAISFSGGILGPGQSCSFDVTVTLPAGLSQGTYTNTTEEISATIAGQTLTGAPASDILQVVEAPNLIKKFTDDPVIPGGSVTLEFTLMHGPDPNDPETDADFIAPGDATAIAFTDNLEATLTGLAYSGPDIMACGGTLSGTSTLSFTGGMLTPGESCTISVPLNVPGGAAPGIHQNNTSQISATVLGKETTGPSVSDDLIVSGLALSKDFINDPAIPGGQLTLQFTMTNIAGVPDATNISFLDDLDDVLDGLTIASFSQGDCNGTITQLAGNTLLQYSNGSLTGGSSCSFDVTLDVPVSAVSNTYTNTTSSFSASFDGGTSTVALPNASAEFEINNVFIELIKEFTNDPVDPNGTVNLRFAITNLDLTNDITGITFSDNLDAALTGLLVSTVLPVSECDGTVSTPDGGKTINFSGGMLTGGATCSFDLTLAVPYAPGSVSTNTTSGITGNIGTSVVVGDPASDDLAIRSTQVINPVKAIAAGPQQPIECSGPNGVSVTLNGSASSPGLAPTTYIWSEGTTVLNPSSQNNPVLNLTGVTLGMHKYKLVVRDAAFNSSSSMVVVMVNADTGNPTITLAGANPQTIECGSGYVELGAMADDVCDGDLTGSIVTDASAVMTGTPGTYQVTYDVMDAAGNAATQVIRTVTVVNDDPPVITLVGDDPQTIECSDLYVELGATADDACEGDLTNAIVIDASAVDTDVPGSYQVTYDVQDAAGNPATQVTRTVTVVNDDPPVITLVGDDPQTFECSDLYVELGATADDACEGDLTNAIVIDASAVMTGSPGTYQVTYDVMDAAGNAATQVTRTVDIVDTTPPTISLTGANPQVIECTAAYTELNATASDACDGDLTSIIVIDASSVMPGVPGSYQVTYNVSDAAGNAATEVIRTVDIVDTAPPTISLIGANPQVIECAAAYTELNATASDACDGDLTSMIVIDATSVMSGVPGSYQVTYNVTDAAGNAAPEVIRTVNIVDTTPPTISLTGANPQVIECAAGYTELNATASDACDGDLTSMIVIDATSVMSGVPGSYQVTYNVSDAAGNPATQITRTVNIVDTTPPTISLTGANPQVIECTAAYTELNATASDACDGDLTSIIVIDASSVMPGVPGSYQVTYNVSDAAGNAATEVIRTVDIVDTAPPVITPASSISLWPANHSYETFSVEDMIVSIIDDCQGNIDITTAQIISASSDEPENGSGDGNTVDDIVISNDCQSVDVRKERKGNGNGRVYTVNIQVSDGNGNSDTSAFLITVPKSNNGNPAFDDGPDYSVGCDENSFHSFEESLGHSLQFLINPNPSNNSIDVNLSKFGDGKISMNIFNIHGQSVYTETLEGLPLGSKKIDISNLPNGTYHMIIQQKDNKESATFIKV